MGSDRTVKLVAPGPRTVSLRKLVWWVLGVTVVVDVASMAVPALIKHPLTTGRGEIRVFLDVYSEQNLPTWWSVGLLTIAAACHLIVGALAVVRRVRVAWAWFVGAATLAALSLDDFTSLHERLERIGKQWVQFDRFPGYWLVPGLAAGAMVAIAMGLLAHRLAGLARWCLVAGVVLLLGSAMGLELVQGLLVAEGESGPIYVLVLHAEEIGENLGVLLMAAAAVLSLTIVNDAGAISVRYGASDVAPTPPNSQSMSGPTVRLHAPAPGGR